MRKLLIAVLLASTALAQDAGRPASKPTTAAAPVVPSARTKHTLREPEHLPESVRVALLRRMGRHADDLEELMFAVLLLQYDDAAVLADRIKGEPRLARPSVDDDSINEAISSKFFTLQDDLRRRAGEVAASAHKKDSKALAEAFGRMTQVCVTCHATYLEIDDRGPEAK